MALRPSTIHSLTKLARSSIPKRQLHITGPATYPSSIMTETRTSSASPESAANASKRPQAGTADDGTNPARHFNTSRSLKSVNDTSTIDFFYLPDVSFDSAPEPPIRVPLLPETVYTGRAARAMHEDESEETLRPLINLVSGSHIHTPSAMSEVSDNTDIDFEGIKVVAAKVGEGAEQGVSAVKQIWEGLLDDILGPKKK
jgi:hypothetical protein